MKKHLLALTFFCALTAAQSFSQCSVTLTTTNATCNGNCDGVMTATPTGGTPPYIYNWYPTGQISQTISGLCIGTYTIVVTDAIACTATASAIITQPPPLMPNPSSTNTPCGLSNGTATANVSGGTPPYTYLWSTSPVQTTETITGLNPGYYTITITDANGCSSSAIITVTMPQQPSPSCSSTPSGCSVANGTATANVSGGTPPYTYLWNPSGQITQTAIGLAPGVYTANVTDANGCTGICNVTVAASSSPIVSLTLVQDTVNTLLWYVYDTITNSTAPYTYFWDFGDGNTSTQPNPTHTYSVAGHYNICFTVTDANGCIGSTCDSTYKIASAGIIQTLIVVNPLTGIADLTTLQKIYIYPNPFSSKTTLQTDNFLHNATLTVDNYFGQTVAQIKNINGQTVTFNRDNLASGLYFLRLTEENKTIAVDKLVITDK